MEEKQQRGKSTGIKEFETRMENIRTGMAENELDLLLFYSPTRGHVRYISNYPTPFPWTHYCHMFPEVFGATDSALVILPSKGEPTLIVTPYGPAYLLADRHSWIRDIRQAKSLAAECKEVVTKSALPHGRIGIAGEEMPQFVYRGLVEAFPKSHFKFVSEMIERIRSVKSEAEIELVKVASKLGDDMWKTIINTAQPGKKIYEITSAAEYTAKSQKAEKVAVYLSSGSQATRSQEVPPSEGVIQKEDILITEISPKFEGYFTQICRVAVFGKPSQMQKDIFNATLKAKEAAIAKAKPGVSIAEIADAARTRIREAGFEKHLRSRFGHGFGLDMTEMPYEIDEHNTMLLQPGMIMTIHPALRIRDLAGSMLGDAVLITDHGAKKLNLCSDEMVQL